MLNQELINKFKNIPTPFYYYDKSLLEETLQTLANALDKYGYSSHYAVKANANPEILKIIASYSFGADCVSANEILQALECGFPASKIVFAGVGKADWEIETALDKNIFCFNCESVQELEVIDAIAAQKGKIAQVALRLNPGIDAHTNKCVNTGLENSKFGINFNYMEQTVDLCLKLKNIKLIGLHFHIGSQILDPEPYRLLCMRSNEMQTKLKEKGFILPIINLGGGLGVDYQNPDQNPIPEFEKIIDLTHENLKVEKGQSVHFEFGRAVVAQCGSLISKVLYIKPASTVTYAILDAGFSDLIRPALYNAYHKIENLTSCSQTQTTYDVAGPICESTDIFATGVTLPQTQRGDYVALRSAGAYGEIMASRYNLRNLPNAYCF